MHVHPAAPPRQQPGCTYGTGASGRGVDPVRITGSVGRARQTATPDVCIAPAVLWQTGRPSVSNRLHNLPSCGVIQRMPWSLATWVSTREQHQESFHVCAPSGKGQTRTKRTWGHDAMVAGSEQPQSLQSASLPACQPAGLACRCSTWRWLHWCMRDGPVCLGAPRIARQLSSRRE